MPYSLSSPRVWLIKAVRWDNAPMERFFRSLKTEWIPEVGYQDMAQAHSHIVRYVTGYYSQLRPHAFNKGLTPNETEARYLRAS